MIREKQTIVFYMRLQGLDQICSQLITHGVAADMPAALITQGTTSQQQLIISTVSNLAAKVAAQEITPPTPSNYRRSSETSSKFELVYSELSIYLGERHITQFRFWQCRG